jgi:hypothetical protein
MRERLGDDVVSINKDYRNVFGYKMKCVFGFNTKGDLKVIQIFCAKRGSIIHGHLQSISFLISKLLQYGCGVEALAKRLETHTFEPSGIAEGEVYASFDHFISKIMRDYKKYKEPNEKK